MKRKKTWIRRAAWAAVLAGIVAAASVEIALRLTPLPAALLEPPPESATFVDRAGKPLRTMLVDERRYAHRLGLPAISPHLLAATLSAEDRRFYSHHGLDPLAIGRALSELVVHRRAVSGASTITQQLVKIALPGPRTFPRKVQEAWLALRLEQVWDKQRILEEYLNRVDYGELQIGIAAASDHFFGKPAADLSPGEAALLAALPKAPARLDPHVHPEAADARRRWVLQRMAATQLLTADDATRALANPVRLVPSSRTCAAPHFVDLLLSRRSVLPPRGGTVPTTLDLDLNRVVERSLQTNLRTLQEKHATAGAAAVLDNASGDVLALACSSLEEAAGAADINTAWMVRSPGSAMKPFTYLLALERGAFPGTVVPDVPTDFPTDTGSYRPNNYNHRFHGPVSLRFALGNSLNVASIRVLELAGGPGALQEAMRSCGLTTLDHPSEFYGLGLTLGNGEVRLLELANAYATLARLGEYQPFRLLRTSAESGRGSGRRVFDSSAAFLLADMLADNSARAASFGLESFLHFDFPVAVKTGTSSDYRDNWCAGYTPEFTVAVWVGNPDGRPMQGITGVTGAAPVLHEIFQHLHATRGTTWYPTPNAIRKFPIEPLTGHLVAENSAGGVWEKATQPPPTATSEDYNASGTVQLPPIYQEWLAGTQNTLGSVVAGRPAASGKSSTAPPANAADSLHVLAPSAGSVFFLDPDLPRDAQCIPLRASSSQPLDWSSDTLTVRAEGPNSTARAQLTEGQHRILARDPLTGQVASTWIEVRSL